MTPVEHLTSAELDLLKTPTQTAETWRAIMSIRQARSELENANCEPSPMTVDVNDRVAVHVDWYSER